MDVGDVEQDGRCPECAEAHKPGAKFCSECGLRLASEPERETRKTVTAVFADVVGSTPLQERIDAEAAHRVMDRFYHVMREVLEAHDGRVAKFIGDAVVAIFGVPAVREDDALRAVRAAGAMRDALAVLNEELERDTGVRIGMRTGVNTGEVVISSEGLAIGDAMNVAARLEQTAGAGEILIGSTTFRHVRHAAQCEPIPPLVLKGKAEPVMAYRLVHAPAGAVQRARIEAPLVGRDDELQRLLDAFDATVQAGTCRLVTIVGSPGLGKTRLGEELAAALAGRARIVQGRCEPTGEGITFLPVAEVLRGAAGIGEADDPATVRSKLAALLSDDPDSELLVERAGGVLGIAKPATAEETFWSVRRLLGGLAREQPLVVLLDDIHWGQPTFLDLVEHLVEWGRQAPILLLAMARPELRDIRPALAEPGRVAADVIELVPLADEHCLRLVIELLDRAEVPEALAGRLLETTEGNPLFLGETLRMFVDEGILRRDGDVWVATVDADSVDVPPTITALLAARIARLNPDERSVVERAAVIGKQFYRGAVADLAPRLVAEGIDSHLSALHRKEVVEPDGTMFIGEPVFRFHHVLIRDAAYRTLLKDARAELHERFADWLTDKAGELVGEHEEVIAFHLEQAVGYRRELGPLDARGELLGQRATALLHATGRRALEREDLPAATNLLRRSAGVLDDSAPGAADVLVDLLEALLSAGHAAEVVTVAERLRGLDGHGERPAAWATIATAQLAQLTDSSALHDTVEEVSRAGDALAAAGDDTGLAKAHHVRAQALALLGQVAEVEAALDQALAAARRADDTRRATAVLSGAPRAALWGPSPVMRSSGRCLDVVRILRMAQGNRHVEAIALRCQAVLEAMRSRTDAAREILDRCRMTLEELGLRLELLETEQYSGIVELVAGEPAVAETHLRIAYDGFVERGLDVGAAAAAALLARALVEQGRDDEAYELTVFSEQRGGESLKTTIAWCSVRARVLAARGEHDEAVALARRAAAVADGTDALVDHGDARLELARVLRTAGDEAQAQAEAQRAVQLYEAKGHEVGAERAATFAGTAVPTTRNESRPDLGLTGSGAWEHLALWRAHNAHDPDAVRAEVHDDVVWLDRRTVGSQSELRGADAFVANYVTWITNSPDIQAVFAILVRAGDLALGRHDAFGHLTDAGGRFELSLLGVQRLEEGRVRHGAYYDVDDEAAALAYLAELGDPAWRVPLALLAALNTRDRAVLSDLLGPDVVLVGPWSASGRGAVLDRLGALPDGRVNAELLDDGRWRLQYVSPEGLTLGEMVASLAEEGGAVTRIDLDAPALDAPPPNDIGLTGAAAEQARTYWRVANTHDLPTLRAMMHDDLVVVDRRPASTEGDMVGADAFYATMESWFQIAPDIQGVYSVLTLAGPFALIRVDAWGHQADTGGRFELPILHLHEFSDGRLLRGANFDADDETGVLAYLAEHADPAWRVPLTLQAAVNTRDRDALTELLAPDVELAGAWSARGREAVLDLIGELPEGRVNSELLDDGRWRLQYVDPEGRILAESVAAITEESGAVTRIHLESAAAERRTAPDVGLTGPGVERAVAYWRAVNGRDLETMRALIADGYVLTDHRILSPEGDWVGADAFHANMLAWFEISPDVLGVISVLTLAGDFALVQIDVHGHQVDTGGAFELSLLHLQELRDGQLQQAADFDPEDEARALARLAELGDPAWRVPLALQAAVNARDREALFELLAPEVELAGAWSARGRDAVLDRMDELPPGRVNAELLDDGRWRVQHVSPEGRTLAELVATIVEDGGTVARIDAEPRPTDNEVLRVLQKVRDGFNARDWDAVRDAHAEDFVMEERRRATGWEEVRGNVAMAELFRDFTTMSTDMEAFCELIEGDDEVGITRYRHRGHAHEGGGLFEDVSIVIYVVRDGRAVRAELHDAEADLAPLRARMEELRPLARRGPRTPTAIDRYFASVCMAFNARDWDALRACFAEDWTCTDRRPVSGWGTFHGPDEATQGMRDFLLMSEDLQVFAEVLEGDDEAGVARFGVRGHAIDGGGLLEEVALCALVLRDGRGVFCENHREEAGVAAVRARAEALRPLAKRRTGAGLPAEVQPTEDHTKRFIDAWDAASASGRWDDFAAQLAPDFELTDGRALAVFGGTRDRDAFVAQEASLAASCKDISRRWETLAAGPALLVGVGGAIGHLADGGGPFELDVGIVMMWRGGLVVRMEVFDPEDEEGLLARYEQLDADAVTSPSGGYLDRLCNAFNRRDWEALSDAFASDGVLVDRRSLKVWPELRGRRAIIEMWRDLPAMAPDLRESYEFLLDDDRVTIVRHRFTGHAAEGGGALDLATLGIHVLRDGRVAYCEFFDPEHPLDELRARREELLPLAHRRPGADLPEEVQAAEGHTLRFMEAWDAACRSGGWDDVSARIAPDFAFADHRTVPTMGGASEVSGWLAGEQSLGESCEIRRGWTTLAAGPTLLALHGYGAGSLVDGGGPFEIWVCIVFQWHDGRLGRLEYFDPEDEAGLLARCAELESNT